MDHGGDFSHFTYLQVNKTKDNTNGILPMRTLNAHTDMEVLVE